jgi:hypothetical protein
MRNDPYLNVPTFGVKSGSSSAARSSGGGGGGGGGGGIGGKATDPRLGKDGRLGVYWVGQNGNVYTKDNTGKVTNIGNYKKYTEADMAQWRKIDDWNTGDKKTGNNNNANANASGSGGIVYPNLQGSIDILNNNISALDPLYEAEVANANKNYEIANNERISNFKKTKATSDATAVTNDQNVLTSRNDINKNARISSEDAMAIIGALGMSGSTTRKALSGIADTSNKNLNSTNFDWGKNSQSILQSWNDYVNEDANQQKQLDDTRNYDVAQAGINKYTKAKDYLGQIATNMTNMGKFDTSNILGRINSANGEIGKLSTIPRAYTGVTPTYTAPAVSELLGQNMAKFDVQAGDPQKSTPKLVKVNEQTPTGDKYGII